MDDNLHNIQLIDELIAISKEAGEAILKVYNSDFDYEIKEDLSPLTKADTLSNHIICKRLKALTPHIPVLSEETSNISFDIRTLWKQYWLVDPLDGTKEFIKRNGEFTVNIALIENNTSVLGVIYVPVTNEVFWGSVIHGSFYSKEENHQEKLTISKKIRRPLKILASKSHYSKKLDLLLNQIKDYNLINKGSSLKFCLVALGEADIYLRFGPTSEWDTAAGEAILRFSGGYVSNTEGKPILYNTKESFINSDFIAANNQDLAGIMIKNIKNN
jgi:3'(2'), 5'-bisphosphate nucleotidase